MALIKCPTCGKEFSDRAQKCPQCGTSMEEVQRLIKEQEEREAAEREAKEAEEARIRAEKRAANKKRALIIIVLFMVILGGYVMYINIAPITAANVQELLYAMQNPLRFSGTSIKIKIPKGAKEVESSAFNVSFGHPGYDYCRRITSIEIPNSVTSIGDGAFGYCRSLTSIEIPNSVTSIGNDAFRECSSLMSVVIPNSVTSIGDYAFEDCQSLTSIEIPNSVTSIGNQAFNGCSSLTSIIVEAGNPIYDSRNNCNAVIETTTNILLVGCQNTIIPNNITMIEGSAFNDCEKMAAITIPNCVTSIRESECKCVVIESAGENSDIVTIRDGNFDNCSNLPIIENIRYADTYLIEAVDRSKSSYSIKEGTKWIGSSAFWKCSGLTSIEIPNSVSNAFRECSSLMSVVIPNSVTNIGKNAFDDCASLVSVTISNSITNIEESTFKGCSSLTSIEIPNSVTNIGDGAFSYCSSLTSVVIPISVSTIGYGAFKGCSNLTIEIPLRFRGQDGLKLNDCKEVIYY